MISGTDYGPNNPPPLRRDGESIEAYRIRAGWDKPTHGGKRPGVGRKKLDPNSETTGISVRVTVAQKAVFEQLGGASWLRYQLDSVIAHGHTDGSFEESRHDQKGEVS